MRTSNKLKMPTLGYWKLRGLAQHIRLLLAYTETEYDEKQYEITLPERMKSPWYAEKFNLGMDFPNLPYYFDGNLKLTESNAIARYIARKHGLDGQTEQEKVIVDMFENLTYNFHMEFVRVCHGPDFENASKAYKSQLPEKLKPFAEFLGDKKFVASDKPTLGDFHFYELLEIFKAFDSAAVKAYPNLVAFMERFEQQPTIKAFLESDKYVKLPFFSPLSQWGST